MLRILIFLAIVFLLGLGFSWVADNPGLVTVTLPQQGDGAAGQEYTVTLLVAVIAIAATIATIMIVWSVMMSIWNSPEIFSRWRKGRRRDRGYLALSRGMIAAAAGDAASARKMTRESGKFLNEEPLVALLDAQTALLEDKHDVAQTKFEAMLATPETRLLGLRGLHVEAERQGAAEAAAHYAERAMELSPEAPWAGTALLRHQSTEGDWAGALKTLETNRWSNKLTKKQNNRLKAVLQTAQAMSLENSSPDEARALALSAHKLAPSLVPAAVITARISSRLGDLRKASNVLEATWKQEPHPEIAEAYVHVRSGDSAVDRLKRARLLAGKRENHVEGRFAIAGAAIDAKDWSAAREALASILHTKPTERACLLMADIEEAEHGDRGRMRDWLSRAVRAPRDPAWTADGYTSEHWAPISPISGRLDAFEWKVPVELLDGPGEAMDYSEFATAPLPPEPKPVMPVISATIPSPANNDDLSETKSGDDSDLNATIEGEIVEPDKNDATNDALDKNADVVEDSPAKDTMSDDSKEKEATVKQQAVAEPDASNGENKSKPDITVSDSGETRADLVLPKLPDDPGVGEDKPQSRRFKLF